MANGPGRSTGNLPAELTSFVGRRRDVIAVERLLAAARLVTLTGVGGVGKSRLALRVATRRQRAFPHGVWLVELATVRAPNLVANTVAAALRVGDQSGRASVDVLRDRLRDRQLLILLDNCEHLPDACAELAATLLRAAPGLTMLATSRQPLGLTGERLWRVAPLQVETPRGVPPAMTLFAQRAAAVVPTFAITADNQHDVAQVCRRLGGLPLSIELAAVWLRTLSVQQLVARLDDRLELLPGGQVPTQRPTTPRAAVRWSYELCSPEEQTLWARLSVFAGSLDVAAVEAVCPGDGVLQALHGLVEKSILLREQHADQPRYRLLETLREYGSRRLRAAGELLALRRAHRDYYLAMAERLDADWFGPGQPHRLARLRAEHDNLRAALQFCLTEPGETRMGQRLAAALWFYWHSTGQLREARHWLDRCLATDRTPCSERVRALVEAGRVAAYQGDLATSAAELVEARALAGRLGDDAGFARATQHLAVTGGLLGEAAQAQAYFEEALATYETLPSPGGTQPFALLQYAMSIAFVGDPATGIELCERCRAASEQHDELWALSYARHGLAYASWRLGRLEQATGHALACLHIKSQFGDLMGIALAMELLGWVTARSGDAKRAAILLGAARHAWLGFGLPLFGTPLFSRSHEACERQLRRDLGPAAFKAAFDTGERLTADQAVAYALHEKPAPPAPPPVPAATITPLTRREQQVAELIGAGMSNRQIAGQLVISQRTAESHVEHILTKLGLANRAQVAIWIASQGHVQSHDAAGFA